MSARTVIALASDHAGLTLRAELVDELKKQGVEALDLGVETTASVDYPDYAVKVTDALRAGKATLGVLVCGTGIGMSIAANKVKGMRAAVCRTELEARMSRAHNDANVLCLGQRITGSGLAVEIMRAFLATEFEGGRHAQRVEKVKRLEEGSR